MISAGVGVDAIGAPGWFVGRAVRRVLVVRLRASGIALLDLFGRVLGLVAVGEVIDRLAHSAAPGSGEDGSYGVGGGGSGTIGSDVGPGSGTGSGCGSGGIVITGSCPSGDRI